MKKISFLTRNVLMRLMNRTRFKNDFLRNLPEAYHPVAKFLFSPFFTSEEKVLAKKIESFRSEAKGIMGVEEVASFSSPRSNTFEKDDKGHSKVDTYEMREFDKVMKTGSGKLNGILLRRLIQGTGVKKILELGTNTGFSGAYFISIPDVELVTIEGSAQLCKIADENMKRIGDKYRIMEMLFDDAIEQLIGAGEKFDCVFIDGQHEKEATIHYAERVMPLMEKDAVFVFDDLYWSDGMNQA